MAIENNIIKSPVHLVANVANILRVNKTNDSALCKHPNVNKWSRYKPFRAAATSFVQDKNNDYLNPDGDRNKALHNANYGLQTPQTYASAEATKGDSGAWVYLKPTGGTQSPFRISDFLNYFHGAKYPLQFKGDIEVNPSYDVYAMIFENLGETTGEYVVPFDELIGDYHVVLYLTWKSNGASKQTYITFPNGEGLIPVSALKNLATPDGNKFDYYMVLSSSESPERAGTFKMMPYNNSINELMGTITLSSSTGAVIASLKKVGVSLSSLVDAEPYTKGIMLESTDNDYFNIGQNNANSLYMELELKNTGDVARTISNIEVSSRMQNFAGAIIHGYTGVSMYNGTNPISSITVPANGTQTVRLLIPTALFFSDSAGSAVDPSGLDKQLKTYDFMFYTTNMGGHDRLFSTMINLRNK